MSVYHFMLFVHTGKTKKFHDEYLVYVWCTYYAVFLLRLSGITYPVWKLPLELALLLLAPKFSNLDHKLTMANNGITIQNPLGMWNRNISWTRDVAPILSRPPLRLVNIMK